MLNGSFLDDGFLGQSGMLTVEPQPQVPPPSYPVTQVHLAADDVVLPGGIILPRKTLYLLAAAVAAAAFVWWLKTRKEQ